MLVFAKYIDCEDSPRKNLDMHRAFDPHRLKVVWVEKIFRVLGLKLNFSRDVPL